MDRSDGRYIAVHEECHEAVLIEIQRSGGRDLNILKSFVVEFWHEGLLSFSVADIDIGLERIGVIGGTVVDVDIGLVYPSVGIESFSMFQRQDGACLCVDPDAADS